MARIAATNAPVFLLDEPTAAPDPDGLAAFYRMVEQHRRDWRTVLFTSHQLGDAERLADRFAVLVAGRLAAVMAQRELHDRLAQRGTMRVRIRSGPPGLLARVRDLAPASLVDGDDLVIHGPPALRLAALDVIRAEGVEIRGFIAEERCLDALYRELVGEVP